MRQTKQVELAEPLFIGKDTFTSVTVRSNTVGVEEDAMENAIRLGRRDNPVTVEICAFELLTDPKIPYHVLRVMNPDDYMAIRQAVNELSSRPTMTQDGETPATEEEKPLVS